ncbi:hypothetical protein [Thalassovita sp.]|uniref:hypothetical protein n=1 Tax=Thalassovita sp. TaxID=1979401 RepID=UPI002B269710|nr:hypothetical protein [Thalassovita sp.]
MTTTPLTARIEVFRPGTFTPMSGDPITYSAADLKAMADAYDPETAPAPIVVGHPDTDAPAFGWVDGFEYDAQADRLFANVNEIEPQFAELVKAGRFKKVSMSFFAPQQGHNPVPGAWYPKHVGFLGAAAPAVSGLKNAKFSQSDGAVTFTAAFGERGFEETASLLRLMRDFFIDRFGLEDADQVLPAYRLEWLGEMEIEKKTDPDVPSYADRGHTHPNQPKKETAVTQQPDPAFAAREAELNERAKTLAEGEAKLARIEHVSFAESLVQAGKLLPASKDKVVAILDALPGEAAVSFSEGAEKLTPGAALREILAAQPAVVSFGALDLPDDPGAARTAAFSADGKPVDPARLELHNEALAYQRQHPGTDYIDAVQAVS